jgi:hypothetical protein
MDKFLSDFKTNLIACLDDLSDQLVADIPGLNVMSIKGDLVVLRIFIKDQIDPKVIMNNFITNILPHREEIKKRNDQFFMNKKDLFTIVKKETFANFKKLWRSTLFDDEDREALWRWADVLVVLADRYNKLDKGVPLVKKTIKKEVKEIKGEKEIEKELKLEKLKIE